MNWQKNVILAAIGVVIWLLVVRWSDFQGQYPVAPLVEQAPQAGVEQLYTERAPSSSTLPVLADEQLPPLTDMLANKKIVTITTDVIKVSIDTLGGDIVEVKLLKNLDKMEKEGGQPISILTRANGNEFIAESGLIGANGTDTASGRPVFKAQASNYVLMGDDEQLKVDLAYNQGAVEIIKRFEFKPSDYRIGVRYIIRNLTPDHWSATFFGQFRRDSHQPVTDSSVGMRPFLGAALRETCLLYTSPSPRDKRQSRMPSSA